MQTSFHGRRAQAIGNGLVRVTILPGGGHIAGISLDDSEVNPLWIPPWPSVEPSEFDLKPHSIYGEGAESRLLASIMGHNLCFDLFGGPSKEEAACGMTVHGEAPVAGWDVRLAGPQELAATAELPLAGMRIERRVRLGSSTVVQIEETVENLSPIDRPVGWTEHVTLGPPFLAPGRTVFETTATRSKVYEADFAAGKGKQQPGAEFDWPWCPAVGGGRIDLRETPSDPVSAGYTAHLMDPSREQAWFAAYNKDLGVLFGYVWQRSDFPWMGIWEENHSWEHPPWNGRTLTRGMEFGVSPMPESRREMVSRGSLFGVPTCRWIPARGRVSVEYCAFIRRAAGPPSDVRWSGEEVQVTG